MKKTTHIFPVILLAVILCAAMAFAVSAAPSYRLLTGNTNYRALAIALDENDENIGGPTESGGADTDEEVGGGDAGPTEGGGTEGDVEVGTTYTISGSITTGKEEGEITINLLDENGKIVETVTTTTGEYSFSVATGSYKISVTKNNITREFDVTTADSNVTLDMDVLPLGDVNKDGRVSITDVVLMRRFLIGYEDKDVNIQNANVNADERVSITDVVLIRRFLIGYKDNLGIGE